MDADVVAAFAKQGIRLSGAEAAAVRDDVRLALHEARAHGIGDSKVDFAAVEIASRLVLARVAIGHGETEGPYDGGAGYSGARSEEPIRVTVVYFVTPVGEVTREDMESFAAAFARWDSQAIWGGSFVTKQTF